MSNEEYVRHPRISLQYSYIRTFPGALKLFQFICDAVTLILALVASNSDYVGHRGYIIFVSACAIVITLVFFLFSFINLQAVCIPERWLFIEFCWCGFISLLYVIAGIIAAVVAKDYKIYGAIAFFAFAALIFYLIDGINRFRIMRSGPRGRHTETHTTVTTTVTRQEPTY